MGGSGRKLEGRTREETEFVSSFRPWSCGFSTAVVCLLYVSIFLCRLFPFPLFWVPKFLLGNPCGSSSHRTALFLGSGKQSLALRVVAITAVANLCVVFLVPIWLLSFLII